MRTATLRSSVLPIVALLAAACGSKPVAVEMDPKSVQLTRKGETKQVKATVLDADNKPLEGVAVEWTSSDPKIASVDPTGKVSALSTGATTIVAAVKDTSAKNQIVVSCLIPAKITADPPQLSLRGAGQLQDVLLAVFDDKGKIIAGQKAEWTSDNPAVATVANGRVTAVADGTATITAKASDASVQIPVVVKGPVATKIEIDPVRVVLRIGRTEQLAVNVIDDLGEQMPKQTATWTSADPNVATVNEGGLVTGVWRGDTSVSATVGEASAEVPVQVR